MPTGTTTVRSRRHRGAAGTPGPAGARAARRLLVAWTLQAVAVAGVLAGLVAAPAVQAAETPRHTVQDPYYGVGLFDFFQQRYFSSLTGLLVAQHFGRLSHHAEDAEILRGGLYLSYGLHREAAAIFTRLIEQGTTPDVRNRAWYYLAKIRYQRGLLPEAEEALGRVQGILPGTLEEDRVMLQSTLMMGRGDYAGAALLLKTLGTDAETSLYARYNLGVALIKSGSVARGSELLDEIGVTPVQTEEFRSLRDKANVALGFASLQDKDPERARVYLERVRLNGMLATKALLGFGWAAEALHEPRAALVPWMELSSRDASDAAVLEARLAVPYALAELGAYGPALDQYGKSITVFDQENQHLDESIAAIRAGSLLDGLLAANPGEEMGWFWNIDRLPGMPHAGHLVEVIAQHPFQEAFKNYRDLHFLAQNLRDWETQLDVIDDMLANRRLAFAQRLPQVQQRERAMGLARLDHAQQDLGAELDQAAVQGDGLALADARERRLLERLARVQAALAASSQAVAGGAPEDPQVAAARERYRLVAGALQWDLAQQAPQRSWEARKSLRALGEALEQAHAHDGALVRAQATEPGHFDDFGVRIGQLHQRVQALIPHVEELAKEQRTAVQEMAVAQLEEQKERLDVYANQAHFAIAQIYDKATAAQEAAHRPATPTATPAAPAVPGEGAAPAESAAPALPPTPGEAPALAAPVAPLPPAPPGNSHAQ